MQETPWPKKVAFIWYSNCFFPLYINYIRVPKLGQNIDYPKEINFFFIRRKEPTVK